MQRRGTRARARRPGPGAATEIDGNPLTAVACPSSDRCIAVDDFGREVTGTAGGYVPSPGDRVSPPGAPGGPTPGGSTSGGAEGGGGSGVIRGGGSRGEARVGHPRVAGDGVVVAISCAGPAGGACGVTLRLTAQETVRGGRILAVGAAAGRRTVVLASTTVSLGAGERRTVRVALDAAGRRLLARHHRLGATFSATESGRTGLSLAVTFGHPGRRA